jgi:hypothetical protein
LPRRLADQGASATLNGPSLPPANPSRGFELMKIADVRTSLSMMRAHANGGDEGVSAKNRIKMHNTCG